MELKSGATVAGPAGPKKDPSGDGLAELLSATEQDFVEWLAGQGRLADHIVKARHDIREWARFCRGRPPANPWEQREEYLAQREVQRAGQPYSAGYLRKHRRVLKGFLLWYRAEAAAGRISFGTLPAELAHAYGSAQAVAPSRKKLLEVHLPCLGEFLGEFGAKDRGNDQGVERLVTEYLERRRRVKQGQGYSGMMTKLAERVTRNFLLWLERQGHLPAGTARGAGDVPAERGGRGPEEILRFFAAKVEADLPAGLRRPLLEYLEHLALDRELVEVSMYRKVRISLALCRRLARDGVDCFTRLRVDQLDETVSSLVSAAAHDIPGRRRQVRALHCDLRCFLRYLQDKGMVRRDLAAALISPPCYRSDTPVRVLSEVQVRGLLESVDRSRAKGRRAYAVLMLMTTYGLRPVDVSVLKLDDLHWRDETITLVQSKTGVALSLPLIAEVARALSEYLREDRDLQVLQRQVFLSLYWPHQPLRPPAVAYLVKEAMRQAGLHKVGARNLRASVATHLLRQGEPLGAIQDVLGHRAAETTQRYALVDPVLLRRVLDEEEQ